MIQLQIKITLLESKPPIWRRFLITDNYRLDHFHQVIQTVMGWTDSHLHDFRIGRRSFGMLLDDGFDLDDIEDETKFYLKDFSLKKGDRIIYLYDFGDGWEHLIEIESVEKVENASLECLKGKRACPPEDCGGIWGYSDMLEIVKNPKHPEYDEYIEWLGGEIDPEYFSLSDINQELKKIDVRYKK